MKLTIFSTKGYEREQLNQHNKPHGHELNFVEARLTSATAALAKDTPAISIFANDDGGAESLKALHAVGVRLIALRSAGFNHVDIETADALGVKLLRVPAYSPHAIAEHTVGLMLTLNRKFHRAFNRIREQNFELDGLLGFDMHDKTVGVVGTGEIGGVVCKILTGFGCHVQAFDVRENADCRNMGVNYVELDALLASSDIISLHCPLTPKTYHLIDNNALQRMKPGVMLINTSRGGVIDSRAAIDALKSGHLGALGIDVYEEEADLFFKDLSGTIIQDDVFARLLSFPNVLVTAHQAFFTEEALAGIYGTTLQNVTDFENDAVDEKKLVTAALVA